MVLHIRLHTMHTCMVMYNLFVWLAVVIVAASGDNADPYFPRFHVRPAFGHVNDPNGPFFDPVHEKYHLFMQANSENDGGWAHFASDDLAHWVDLGIGIPMNGVGCPNQKGCFSGSTVVYKDDATIVYPGVHEVPQSATHPDGIGMAQCLARPTNSSDPFLTNWSSTIIVPTDPLPADVNNHFHDDAEPWKSASDGRWYTFASGGDWKRNKGINLLYSTTEENFMSGNKHWRQDNFLWNISNNQCNFVSCPELYSLPGTPSGVARTSGTVIYESLCGCDQYWLGHYDDEAHTFTPFSNYVPPSSTRRYCYDYGKGRASKSFWDDRNSRRLMWSWVTGGKQFPNSTWDGTQTIPRVISMHSTGTNETKELAVNPAAEVDRLRLLPAAVSVANQTLPSNGNGSGCLYDAGSVQLDIVVNFTWDGSHHNDVAVGVNVLVGQDNDKSCSIQLLVSQNTFDFIPNTNIPHGDLPGKDFRLNGSRSWTPEEGNAACASGCDQIDECTCWTYVPSGPRCAIKGPGGWAGGPLFPVPEATLVSGYKKGYQPKNLTLPESSVEITACDGSMMPGHLATRTSAKLRVIVDHSVIEVYDGVNTMSFYTFPSNIESATRVMLVSETEGVNADLEVFKMRDAIIPKI